MLIQLYGKRWTFYLQLQDEYEYPELASILADALNKGAIGTNENTEALNNRQNLKADKLVAEQKSNTIMPKTAMKAKNIKRLELVAENPNKHNGENVHNVRYLYLRKENRIKIDFVNYFILFHFYSIRSIMVERSKNRASRVNEGETYSFVKHAVNV